MPWSLTDDVDAFAARAWDLLARDPAEQTVALTVVEALRAGEPYSDEPAVFATYEAGGEVRGAVAMTPPYELLLAVAPEAAVAELVAALRRAGVAVPGVNGDTATVERFAAAWTAGMPLRARTVWEQRLYALGTLRPPDPPPPGSARAATGDDADVAAAWLHAFQVEAGVHTTDVSAMVRERTAGGRLWLWEDEAGRPASLAARTAPAAGVARVAPVYTPPEHRRRGYGAAVTAACTADALARDADHVVLFTDLANPTSNAVYQRIGFAGLTDRRVVRFTGS